MQFQVPQFIDVEDKIFGPLTLKQFLFLAGAAAVSFMLFFMLAFKLWIAVSVILMGLAGSLAFIRINGRSMFAMLVATLRYVWFPKFYLWQYVSPTQQLPTIHELPKATPRTAAGPLKSLLLKFNTARGAVSRNA